jgi:hypothetical protein
MIIAQTISGERFAIDEEGDEPKCVRHNSVVVEELTGAFPVFNCGTCGHPLTPEEAAEIAERLS